MWKIDRIIEKDLYERAALNTSQRVTHHSLGHKTRWV